MNTGLRDCKVMEIDDPNPDAMMDVCVTFSITGQRMQVQVRQVGIILTVRKALAQQLTRQRYAENPGSEKVNAMEVFELRLADHLRYCVEILTCSHHMIEDP